MKEANQRLLIAVLALDRYSRMGQKPLFLLRPVFILVERYHHVIAAFAAPNTRHSFIMVPLDRTGRAEVEERKTFLE